MAEDKEKIVIQFDTNADKASKDVDKLTTSITQTEEVTKKSTKANKELKDSTDKAAESSKSQKEALDLVGGGFASAIEGAKGLIKQFFLLLANPIVAALAAVVGVATLVFKAFTSTKEGGEALDRVFAGIGATVDVLRDRFLQLVNGIASLNIREVIASFTGLGDEIERESSAAGRFAKSLQDVANATRTLNESRAKLNRDLAESERILTSSTASFGEKKKALEEVGRAEAKQTNAELANAKKKLKAIDDQNDLSNSSSEALQIRSEAQIAVFELEQKSAEDRRKVSDFQKTLQGEEQARLKTINDEEKARLKQVNDSAVLAAKAKKDADAKAVQDGIDKRKKEAQDRQDIAVAAQQEERSITDQLKEKDKADQEEREATLIKNGENELAILQANVAEEDRIKNEQLQQQKNRDEVLASSKASLLGIVANLESSGLAKTKAGLAISKGIALTQIGIDSAVAISKASTLANAEGVAAQLAFPTVPGIGTVARVVSYASTAVSVISNIARAKQLLSSGGGSGGSGSNQGAAPSPRGSNVASAAPQTGFQPSATNQLATSISANTNDRPIIKAYVVAQDVTDQQKKDTDLVSQNSFGGVIP
jgi:hypothetical protein